jgi:hypothetical protein
MPAARTVTPSPPASIHTVEVQDDNNVEDHPSDANERTSLLRTTSRNSAAPKVYVNSKHGRVAKPTSAARRPATVEQEAVKVQQGQRVSPESYHRNILTVAECVSESVNQLFSAS